MESGELIRAIEADADKGFTELLSNQKPIMRRMLNTNVIRAIFRAGYAHGVLAMLEAHQAGALEPGFADWPPVVR